MWYMEYRVLGNNAEAAWDFWEEKPHIFWYSTLIIFCLVALIYGVFHRPFRTIGIAFAIITIITYINNTKVSFRGTPLLPEDFQLTDQAGTLTKFIDFGELVRVILASVLAVALGFILDYLTKARLEIIPALPKVSLKKKFKTKKARANHKKLIEKHLAVFLIPRILIIPLSIWGLHSASNFVTHLGGSAYQEVDWLDNTKFVAWNQSVNYNNNGFVLGFLYNINKTTLEQPANYSKDTISKIKTEYSKEAGSEPNASKKSLKDADYNIVVVLNESYYDTSLIQDDYPFEGEDPLPIFHELMTKYPAGYMYSPDYGGGTANIEFEVDTGLSNFWAKTVPFTDLLPKMNSIISYAKDAKAAGYNTTAIHSFTGGMYKRDIALKKEGFDTFITDLEMKHQTHDGNSLYINDQSVYNETLDVLRGSKEKQFVSVITMQNHAPYYKSNYDDSDYHFTFSVPGWDQNFCDTILAYLESAYRADGYLGEFLENLNNLDEKTVVLFYGDHAPGIFSITHQGEDENAAQLTQLTPYFIWSNFAMPGDYANSQFGKDFLKEFGEPAKEELATGEQDTLEIRSENVTLPTTTPNCLPNALYGTLNLRRNAWQTLLEKTCSENPILTPYYLDNKEPSGKATDAYKLVNYDILGGRQYWLSL